MVVEAVGCMDGGAAAWSWWRGSEGRRIGQAEKQSEERRTGQAEKQSV